MLRREINVQSEQWIIPMSETFISKDEIFESFVTLSKYSLYIDYHDNVSQINR